VLHFQANILEYKKSQLDIMSKHLFDSGYVILFLLQKAYLLMHV